MQKLNLQDMSLISDRALLSLSILLLSLLILPMFGISQFSFVVPYLYSFLWIAFIVEFGIKLYMSKRKWNYISREFFVFFIILFPFLRPLRLFPLSRWGLLIFAEEVNDHFPMFRKYRILEILLISIVLVVLSADLFLLVEKTPDTLFKNFADAVWFSMVTVATVGYGDIYPKTSFGRVLAGFLIFFGVSVFGIITASISSYLVELDTRKERQEEMDKIGELERKEDMIAQKIDELHKLLH
jgi:voltage-gated potassium channel